MPRPPIGRASSAAPELLRPVFSSDPRLAPQYLPTSAYRRDSDAGLVVIDGFAPSQPPERPSLWIAPPDLVGDPDRLAEAGTRHRLTVLRPEAGATLTLPAAATLTDCRVGRYPGITEGRHGAQQGPHLTAQRFVVFRVQPFLLAVFQRRNNGQCLRCCMPLTHPRGLKLFRLIHLLNILAAGAEARPAKLREHPGNNDRIDLLGNGPRV